MKIKRILCCSFLLVPISFPIVSISACSQYENNRYQILPTYTGQADQLLALNIVPDYYPLQLNSLKPYNYLQKGLSKFMIGQSNEFKEKFELKILSMLSKVKKFGVSWWNQQAAESSESNVDPTYWQRQEADILLYEHYLLDDDKKIINSSVSPKHKIETAIETNFRVSRDPYTRLSKWIIAGINDLNNNNNNLTISDIDGTIINHQYSQNEINIIKSLEELLKNPTDANLNSQLYNDAFFAQFWHNNYWDNKQFKNSVFKDWIIDTNKNKLVFDLNANNNYKIANLFKASTYTKDEIDLGINLPTYISSIRKRHHPIYEQQSGKIGTAPMFEGSTRDTLLYLYNIASQIDNLATTGNINLSSEKLSNASQSLKDSSKKVLDYLKNEIDNQQLSKMKNALENASSIFIQINKRLNNMKKYFNQLGASGKTFGIITIAPGSGETTIQTTSKYSWLYRELGFLQPIPNNLNNISSNPMMHASMNGALFNMDDNGWWWNLSGSNDSRGQVFDNCKFFSNEIDLGIITARDENFKASIIEQPIASRNIASMFKNNSNLEEIKVDYDLWNEGIKTPFVFNMVLDRIINITETWAKKNNKIVDDNDINRKNALDWGKYWTEYFIN